MADGYLPPDPVRVPPLPPNRSATLAVAPVDLALAFRIPMGQMGFQRILGDLDRVLVEDRHVQPPSRLDYAGELEQPGIGEVVDVGEHRPRVDEPKARVLEVKFDTGESVIIPRANVELIEG